MSENKQDEKPILEIDDARAEEIKAKQTSAVARDEPVVVKPVDAVDVDFAERQSLAHEKISQDLAFLVRVATNALTSFNGLLIAVAPPGVPCDETRTNWASDHFVAYSKVGFDLDQLLLVFENANKGVKAAADNLLKNGAVSEEACKVVKSHLLELRKDIVE